MADELDVGAQYRKLCQQRLVVVADQVKRRRDRFPCAGGGGSLKGQEFDGLSERQPQERIVAVNKGTILIGVPGEPGPGYHAPNVGAPVPANESPEPCAA